MYKALISFSGTVSMRKGEVRDIKDPEVVADLLKAKYIVDLDATTAEPKKATKKTSKGGIKL